MRLAFYFLPLDGGGSGWGWLAGARTTPRLLVRGAEEVETLRRGRFAGGGAVTGR